MGNALGAVVFHEQSRLPLTFVAGPAAWVVVLSLPAVLQWLVLRHWFSRTGWWIPASAVGSFLSWLPLGWGIAVEDTKGGSPFANFAVPGAFILTGAVAGAVEWFVLRRWVSRAGWWVLARSIGSFGAIHVFASMTRGADVRFFWGGLASGALSGAVSGLALVWLRLRKPKKNEPSAVITDTEPTNETHGAALS